MIQVSDYIVKYLEDYGIKNCFMVVGGGAMFIDNSFGKSKKIKCIFNHHEQASAIAAEGYSRVNNTLSVVSVTSGPGGTNTLTGVICNWLDSIPVLYISGQVKFETTISSVPNSGLRQLGDQEIDIVNIVKPVTKYVKMITDPNSIKYELQKAISIATTGRFGPVWLDIPISTQSALVEEDSLKEYTESYKIPYIDTTLLYKTIEYLKQSKKPLFVAGHGIRLAEQKEEFLNLIESTNIPVVTTFNGFDLIPSNHKNYVGRIGTLGTRAGNIALQNSDLIIFFGTRNNIRQVGYDWSSFGKNAKKVLIDIDEAELFKKTVKGDILINANVKDFIFELNNKIKDCNFNVMQWLNWCKEKKEKYPVLLEDYKKQQDINPYYFIDRLTSQLQENDIVVAANGTACVSLFQAGIVKNNQRIFWNSGCATMGYEPAIIGACLAARNQIKEINIVCISGDGSIQMNIQELQTISYNNLPIKIFVLCNNGYNSIIQTQRNFFGGSLIGCNEESGISFPELSKVAQTYNMKYYNLFRTEDIDLCIKDVLSYDGSVLCGVTLGSYTFMPKVSSEKKEDGTMISQPLENMYPFLNEEEMKSNVY